MALSTRNILLIGAGAALLAGLAWATWRTDPIPVDLHTVERGTLRITVNADGQTRIRDIYEIAAPIAGIAQRSPVAVGDPVVAGETVVAIVEPAAPTLLDTRSRVQAEAAVREAEAALHVAETSLLQAEEDYTLARSQFERTQTLVERNVASLSSLEDATQRLTVAAAAREAASARIGMAQSALDRARAALIEPVPARGGAETCCIRLTAPVDGVVLSVDQISERPVAAGATLVSIGDPAELEIVADVLSSDAVRIPAGADAIVERWGGDVPLTARLRRVEPAARTQVSALGIEEQRVDAIFDLVTPREERAALGDGFAVFLRIVEWQSDETLTVPISALFRDGEGWAVFRAIGEIARLTPVEVGRMGTRDAQILSGLE
ncbi:MAG: efflux RND transporter periplasmic adaptor subunit, partial [Rubricella sp.]